MPTNRDINKPLPSKKELMTWSRQHQTVINETKQHLLDLTHQAPAEREAFKRLVSELVQASYALGGVHADLAEGRHS